MIENSFFTKIVDLTLAVYRVTSFFPQGEPIRDHIRSRANSILTLGIKGGPPEEFFSEVDILRGHFAVAREQQWVKKINFDILDTAYKSIKQEFRELSLQQKRKENMPSGAGERERENIDRKKEKVHNKLVLPDRQKKIFDHIAQNGATQASDLLPVLTGVNIRTIRRDLQHLIKYDLLEKEQKGRQIFFRIKDKKTGGRPR